MPSPQTITQPSRAIDPTKKTLCKVCGEPFEKERGRQKVCGPACALKFVVIEHNKSKAKELRKRRLALKGKREWLQEAQHAVNRYIRWRDYGKPCICCQKPLKYFNFGGSVDASHYLARSTHPGLRFHLLNVHAGCAHCNKRLAGNPANYRLHLIERYGLSLVERLEGLPTHRDYSIEYLKRLKKLFSRRAKFYRSRITQRRNYVK